MRGSQEDINGEWSESTARSLYNHVREILVHGIPDYPFSEILPGIQRLVKSFFPGESEVREELIFLGVELPEGPISQAWIDEKAAAYLNESKMLRAEGKKREANRIYGIYLDISHVDLLTAGKIEELSSWKDILTQLPKILEGSKSPKARENAKRVFRYFTNFYERLKVNQESFGKYFEEIERQEQEEFWMIPVKGIAAGIAIDSGSDCGKGGTTNRSIVDEYNTFLLANRDRTKLWGYVGLYEVDGDGKLVLQVDAMNPTTDLDLSGTSFLGAVRDHFSLMAKRSASQERPIAAFLASKESERVSNRESISRYAAEFHGSDAKSVFQTLKPRLSNIDKQTMELSKFWDEYEKAGRELKDLLLDHIAWYRSKREQLEEELKGFIRERIEAGLGEEEIKEILASWGIMEEGKFVLKGNLGLLGSIETDDPEKIEIKIDRNNQDLFREILKDRGRLDDNDDIPFEEMSFVKFYDLSEIGGETVFIPMSTMANYIPYHGVEYEYDLERTKYRMQKIIDEIFEMEPQKQQKLNDAWKKISNIAQKISENSVVYESNWQADPKYSAIFYMP